MLAVLCICATLTLTRAFEMGAPLASCVSMFPSGHGVNAREDDPPYTITVNESTYSANQEIEVVINSTGLHGITFFEGLMVQARAANCSDHVTWNTIGSFILEDGEDFLNTVPCHGGLDSAVTHKAHDHIVSKTFRWKAPSLPAGPVYIRGTIVRRQTDFWTNVFSAIIKDSSAPDNTGNTCEAQKYACTYSSNEPSLAALMLPNLKSVLVCALLVLTS